MVKIRLFKAGSEESYKYPYRTSPRRVLGKERKRHGQNELMQMTEHLYSP